MMTRTTRSPTIAIVGGIVSGLIVAGAFTAITPWRAAGDRSRFCHWLPPSPSQFCCGCNRGCSVCAANRSRILLVDRAGDAARRWPSLFCEYPLHGRCRVANPRCRGCGGWCFQPRIKRRPTSMNHKAVGGPGALQVISCLPTWRCRGAATAALRLPLRLSELKTTGSSRRCLVGSRKRSHSLYHWAWVIDAQSGAYEALPARRVIQQMTRKLLT
jgi:hypothetical protein